MILIKNRQEPKKKTSEYIPLYQKRTTVSFELSRTLYLDDAKLLSHVLLITRCSLVIKLGVRDICVFFGTGMNCSGLEL